MEIDAVQVFLIQIKNRKMLNKNHDNIFNPTFPKAMQNCKLKLTIQIKPAYV